LNKRQARLFALGSTLVAAVVFVGLTFDSHRQFPKLTNAAAITPAVSHGKDVWHKNNCINCHTLFGEGAYYAPDLTKIAQLRGAPYLQAYLRDPSKFYDEQRHRRLMPKQDMSEVEIIDLVAFLDWVSKVDNNGWPPRPLLVTGASIGTEGAQPFAKAATTPSESVSDTADKDPIALGAIVFRTASPACGACHSLQPDVTMVGPSLAGVASRAQQTLASGDYKGQAKDVEGYLVESVTSPSAHITAGGTYSTDGVSLMPATFAKDLTPEQVRQLAVYLATFK